MVLQWGEGCESERESWCNVLSGSWLERSNNKSLNKIVGLGKELQNRNIGRFQSITLDDGKPVFVKC